MKATGDDSFQIILKEPYGLVTMSLAKPSSNVPFMMPERVAKTPSKEQISEYVGSGPFVFDKETWKPGDKAVFTKFAGYKPRSETPSWASGGKVVKVDVVEWISIKDHQTALNALIEGEIDYIESPPNDLLPLMEAEENIKLRILNPLGAQFMFRLNHLHPPFDNVKVRRAALASINQKDFLQAVIGNPDYYKECAAMFVCGSSLATDKGAELALRSDFALSKKLLKEAEYDGTPIVIMQSTDVDVLNNLGPVAASNLKKGGFNVDLQAMDWQTLVARRAKREKPEDGGWNVFMTSWTAADILNPIMAAGFNAGCDKAWFGWPCDYKMQRLRDQFARETNAAEQKLIAEKIQVRAMEIVTHVHGGQWYRPAAWRGDRLSGVLDGPVSYFWNIAKK
jgi:peptide/nickel transport system substrate-binding protein